MNVCQLKPGRERSLLRRHPWVFASSLAHGGAGAGETVRVVDAQGRFLAWAAFSPSSSIRLRIWSFEANDRIDAGFIRARLQAAHVRRLALKQSLELEHPHAGWRVVNAEADGLPGLVVDHYAGVLVVQMLACGVERWRDVIVSTLRELFQGCPLLERSDTDTRALEGLPERVGWLDDKGLVTDTLPQAFAGQALLLHEHGLRYTLDLLGGQKTGFYLDQRDNRKLLRQVVAQHGLNRVLNCHCYSGGFGLNARMAGAQEVIGIDTSRPALALAERNEALNAEVLAATAPGSPGTHLRAMDVNAALRAYREAGEHFDLIVLDPPKLAPTSAHVERAARAYKDMNRIALGLLRPGGWLMTFSCSSGITPDLFQKIVASAAEEARRDARLVQRLQAGADHPVQLAFPEGDYLKGLLLQAD